MTRDLGIFTHEDAIEIGRRVLGNRYKQPLFDNTRDATVHNDLYYVVLIEDLDPATNSKTGHTTAQGRILRYVQPAVSDTLNMEDSTTDEGLVSITNRFTTFSASTGDLILIIRNGSEWSPVNVASSSGAPRIRFTILSTSFTVGLGALGCDHVVARVDHISCGGTGVSVGDEVNIYDPEYCHFNLPIELLIGLSGTATWMKSDNYQQGLEYVLDCLYDIQTAGCMWMIDTLCCSEEEIISG